MNKPFGNMSFDEKCLYADYVRDRKDDADVRSMRTYLGDKNRRRKRFINKLMKLRKENDK